MLLAKRNKKNRYPGYLTLVVFLAMIIVLGCSINIDKIDIPNSVNGGETLPVTLHVTLKTDASSENKKIMVAVLVPKLWNVSKNSTVTFTSDITSGTQNMSVIPAGTAAPQGGGRDWPTLLSDVIGKGGNLLSGWEWVAFYSNGSYNVAGNSTIGITINIKMKVSNDNISFKLGYVVANNSDGLSGTQYYNAAFTDCFTVNGTGELIDFCNPQLSTGDPINALDNDIVALNFDGGIITNKLEDQSDIYLCVKGISTDGVEYTKCVQDSSTLAQSYGVKKWRIDIWPRGLLSVPSDKKLDRLEYYFTDKSGNIKVGKTGDDSTPFTFAFKCP